MARRLSVEARRREILDKTRELIIEKGTDGISLRSVAKYCGMSAPGLLHHFDGLKPLLEEVLKEREQAQLAAYVEALPEDPTLRQWTDTVAKVAMQQSRENRRFDALETQALASPEHPAYDFYSNQLRPFPTTVALAAREYPKNPEMVVAVLGTVVDGLRLRWLRSPDPVDYINDWEAIADTVFAGFEQFRD